MPIGTCFSFFFLIWFLQPHSRIFHLYRANRSSKVGENWRTRGKTLSRTWLSHMWPGRDWNHSGEKAHAFHKNLFSQLPIQFLKKLSKQIFISFFTILGKVWAIVEAFITQTLWKTQNMIIWHGSDMLNIKFGPYPFNSPGKENFWRVFTIYGHGHHFGHVTKTPWTNFHSPIPWRLHMKFGFNPLGGLWKEEVWKCFKIQDCFPIVSLWQHSNKKNQQKNAQTLNPPTDGCYR